MEAKFELVKLTAPLADWTGSQFIIRSEDCPGGVAAIIGGAEEYAPLLSAAPELEAALRQSPCTCNSEETFVCARCAALAGTEPAAVGYLGVPLAEGVRTYGNCKVCGALLVKDWCLSCGTPRAEMICEHCKEELKDGDSVIPFNNGALAMHRECGLRCIVGSLAHVEKRCSCYVPGAEETDPPGMTAREAARAAVEAWERQNLELYWKRTMCEPPTVKNRQE